MFMSLLVLNISLLVEVLALVTHQVIFGTGSCKVPRVSDSPCSKQIWDKVMLPKFSALIPNLLIKAQEQPRWVCSVSTLCGSVAVVLSAVVVVLLSPSSRGDPNPWPISVCWHFVWWCKHWPELQPFCIVCIKIKSFGGSVLPCQVNLLAVQ